MNLRPAVVLAALVAAVAACDGGGRAASVPGAGGGVPLAAATFDAEVVPRTIAGLRAEREDIGDELADVGDESYATVLELWSLREGERLRATLQITRLAPDARPEDPDFLDRIAAQIGSTDLRKRLVGDQVVYVATANGQSVAVWFRGLHYLTLTVAADHPAPRSLLRAATEEVRP